MRDEGSYTAAEGSHDKDIANPERAALHKNGCDRAAPSVEFCLHDSSLGQAMGIRFQLQHLSLEQNHLQQGIKAQFLLRRDFHEDRLPAPGLRNQVVLRERVPDSLGIRPWLINLVD